MSFNEVTLSSVSMQSILTVTVLVSSRGPLEDAQRLALV